MDELRRPLDGVTVLVVDDNADGRYVLETLLRHAGAFVILAATGHHALEHLTRVRPHVIVSDVAMPGFSGYDFVRAVRQLADVTLRETPAIALTAFNEPGEQRRALETGFQHFMLKPFEATVLIEAVARLARAK